MSDQFVGFTNLCGPQDGVNFDPMWDLDFGQQNSGLPRQSYSYSHMNHTDHSHVSGYGYNQGLPDQSQFIYDDASKHALLRVDTGAPPRVHVSSDPSSSTNSAGSIPLTPFNSWGDNHLQVHVPPGTPLSSSGTFTYPFSPTNQKGLSPIPSPISPRSPAVGSSDEGSSGLLIADDDDDEDAPQPMIHILQWKSIREQAIIVTGTDIYIPQTIYQPYTEADRVRYIEKANLKDPIIFVTSHPDQWGIPLEDALRARMKDLVGRDDHMFVDCGPSVSIRLQWPGYRAWTKQIPTMDFKSPKCPITRGKLAKNIANCVKRFIEDKGNERMEIEADRRWKVGTRGIRMEDLMLVSLHHISKGSWQPQLRLRTTLNVIQERRASQVLPPGV